LLNSSAVSSENPAASRKSGAERRDFFRVSKVARFTLGYTVFVILFGAVVRITGSGAGCGQHWPTCNGEIVHLPRRLETVIELTHRVTSAGALLAVLAFAIAAFLGSPRGDRLRRAAYAAVGLMVVEALIGAALVLFRLVAADASTARAWVMPAHLVSTYALVAVMTLSVIWSASSGNAPSRIPGMIPEGRFWLLLGAAAIVLVAGTGALTALGDTLYPPAAHTIAGRVLEDQGRAATGLQRLRMLHPLLAVTTAIGVAALVLRFGTSSPRASRAVLSFIAAQLAAGVANVLLSAPGWMQVVHLGLSLALWMSYVALVATLQTAAATEPSARA
jgi:heme A synthase